MYGSTSDKARISESDRSYNRYVKNYNRRPQPLPDITAQLSEDEPALLTLTERVGRMFDIDRLHAEALKMHEQWFYDQIDMERDCEVAPWEAELLIGGVPEGTAVAYSSEAADAAWEARMRLEEEDRRERDARYDGAFDGYSSDVYEEDGYLVVDCWLPFMRLPELRDTFGENWLGNGFHIVQGNGVRR